MFLDLAGHHQSLSEYGHTIKDKVWQHARIPVGVGIASTKTLAKLANRGAKSCHAVPVSVFSIAAKKTDLLHPQLR